jgi:DNA-binding response OmpR family regulator
VLVYVGSMAGDPADDGRPTVLVVGEDEASATRYGGWLARRYDVRTAHEGAAAVEMLRTSPDAIDAILLDRRTGDASDDLVLVSIRDVGVDCPVALVTDERPDGDVVERGFDDYLVAPVSEGALLRSVDSLLRVEGREALRQALSTKRVRRNVLQLERSEEELARDESFARLERDIERLERRLSLHRERLAEQGKRGETRRTENAVRT